MMFKRVLYSTIAFELLFGRILRLLELDFWLIFEPPGNVFWIPRRICRNMRGSFQVAGLTSRIRATRDRSTERQRDRETERQRDRETERHRDTEAEGKRQRDRGTETET